MKNVIYGKMFLPLSLLTLISAGTVAQTAQVPHIQWQKNIGGDDDDELFSLQQTADGGYILGGFSNSQISGDKTSNTCYDTAAGAASYDYWIVKIDCAGNIQWQKDIGGSDDDIVNSIKQTADGGYFIGGYTASNASCDKISTVFSGCGANDWWAMKLDNIGNIQWQKDLGGSANDFLNSVEQTADKGYILGGDSRSNISANKTVNICGLDSCVILSDYWMVKLDSTGNIQWQKDIGGTPVPTGNGNFQFGDDNLNVLHQTRDGGYILGGTSNSDISCTKTSNAWNNTYDYWVVKTDSIGNIQWQKDIGGNGIDELNDMQQTADGGYILGGSSTSGSSGNKTSNTYGNGSLDYWVVKLDNTGNIQWQKDIGGDNFDELNAIEQTTDHGYILGGFSNSDSSGNKTSNPLGGYGSGQFDYWIVKLDSTGSMQWQLDIGRNDTQAVLFAVQQTTDGGYILGGVSNPSSVSISGKVNNVGNPYGSQFGGAGTHYWVAKLGDCSATYCGAPPQQRDSICAGKSVTLIGNPEYGAFNWEALPGGSPVSSLSCDTCIDPIATPTQTTQYVEVSASNTYCNDTATVVVHPANNSVRIDTNICFDDSVQLNIPIYNTSLPHSIVWTPALYLNNNTISNPVCTPPTGLSYIVTVTNNDVNKCTSVDTVTINIYSFTPLIGSLDGCYGMPQGKAWVEPRTGDTAIYTYTWTDVYGDVLQPPTINSIIADTLYNRNPGTYMVTLRRLNGCDTTLTVTIPTPVRSFINTSDTGICPHDTVTIYATGGISYHWKPDDRSYISDTSVADPKVSPLTDWSYVVYGENSSGCLDTATAHVRVFPSAVIQLPDSVTLYYGESYQFNPRTNCLIFGWFPPFGLSADNISNPIASPPVDTKYVVTGTTEEGCMIKDSVNVYRSSDVILTLPNAFTPGNGPDNLFKPIHEGDVTLDDLRIFNRWGQLVYESSDINAGWDGTRHGTPQPEGVYVYVMEGHTAAGKIISKQGNVTLLR